MSEFIPLSVPNFGPREAELASEAITSGWVSTSGGKVTEFEEALANYVGMPRAVASHLPGGRTVAGNDGLKDRSLPLSHAGIQRIQQLGREAFRLLTAIFHLNDLREDG